LDRECRQPDITQPVLLEFCRKIVKYLLEVRHIPLNDLLRFKFQLAKAIQLKIVEYRNAAYANGYQIFLFSNEAQSETSFVHGFSFLNQASAYLVNWFYKGRFQFTKHFYANVGELKSEGEEFDCAVTIDTLPQVKYWIRNLAGKPLTSFWLPTSTDRFYPDFVVELHDGRILVVEYKGALLADSSDTKEKKNIGELWANKSAGKGIFIMAEKRNSQGRDIKDQIISAISN